MNISVVYLGKKRRPRTVHCCCPVGKKQNIFMKQQREKRSHLGLRGGEREV